VGDGGATDGGGVSGGGGEKTPLVQSRYPSKSAPFLCDAKGGPALSRVVQTGDLSIIPQGLGGPSDRTLFAPTTDS
jgi:hypothetical protein